MKIITGMIKASEMSSGLNLLEGPHPVENLVNYEQEL
tara:strand:- start:642 stop:752 length:111 start_codon:yes stop_codon:yes gene_type:complete